MAGGDRMVVVRLIGMVGQFRSAMATATSDVRALDAAVMAANRNMAAGSAAMARSGRGMASGMSGTLRSMRGLMLGLGAPLAVGAMVKSWLDFERQMAHTNAVASDVFGKSEVGHRRLRASALTLGAAYGFSATEVGKAQEELAKAGRSTVDILGGDLPAALTLAAAGTISLDDAAKHIAVSMTQFASTGAMMGEQGIRAAQVSDLLAKSANATVSDVGAMATALSYVGPQAASLGMSLQETVTTIALLNQAGIDGDRAGTNLRGMLTGLMSPSHMAKMQMDALGLSVFDTGGKFIGMASLAQELKDKLGGMTDAEQQNIIGRLTTNAAMPAFIIMTKAGAAGWELMKRKIDASASASDVARAKLDSVTGKLSIFGATMQNSAIKTVENFNGAIGWTAEKATGLVKSFGEMGTGAQFATLALVGQMFVARRLQEHMGRTAGSYRAVKTETAGLTREHDKLRQLQNRIGTGPGQVRPGFAAMSGLTQAQIAAQQRVVAAQAAKAADAQKGAGPLARVLGTGAGTASAGLSTATTRAAKFSSVFRGAMASASSAAKGLMGVMGGPWGAVLAGGLLLFQAEASKAAQSAERVLAIRDAVTQLGAAYLQTGSVSSSAVQGLIDQGGPLSDLVKHTQDYGFSLTSVAEAASGNEKMQRALLDVYEKQVPLAQKGIVAAQKEQGSQFMGNFVDLFSSDSVLDRASRNLDIKKDELSGLREEFKQRKLINDITKESQRIGLSEALAHIGKDGVTASEGTKAMALNLEAMNAEGAKFEDVLKAGQANLQSLASAYLSVSDAQAAFRSTTLGEDAKKSFGVDLEKKGAKPTIAPRVSFTTGQFNTRTAPGLQQHAAASQMAQGAFKLGEAVNAEALSRMPDDLKKVGAAGLVAAQQFKNARDEFIGTYTALGMNAVAAGKLADAYGLIPSKFTTSIGARGAEETISQLNHVGVQVEMIPETGEVVVSASTEPALRKLVGLRDVVKDPITGQVKYVFPNADELAKLMPALNKPLEVPVAYHPMQGLPSGPAGSKLATSTTQTVVTTYAPLEPLPDQEVAVNPNLGPLPPIPPTTVPVTPIPTGQPHFGPVRVAVIGVPTGIPDSIRAPGTRWGGIKAFARGGIQAHVARGDLIRYAEPETGGEAFIPRKGDPGRSRSILEQAASWYGLGVHKMAAGGILGMAVGGITRNAAPLGDFMSRFMEPPQTWWTDRADAMIEKRDAALALAEAQKQLRDTQKDSKHTALDLAKAQNALTDARRNLALANTQLAKANMPVQDQFKGALDAGVRNTGSFIANLNILASKGYGALAMQLLQMGGPQAEAIAAGAKNWSTSTAVRVNDQAQTAANQQKTLENMPAMIAIRDAVARGRSYGALIGSGDFTGQEINAALSLMQAELSKTSAGRAMLAAMHGDTKAALGAQIRGFATGGIAAPGTLFRFAEPSTGGEAVIPRFGTNALPTLAQAAGWHGMSLQELGNRRSVPARPVQVVITVRGEGVLSSMIETRVDGALVQAAQAVTRGRAIRS